MSFFRLVRDIKCLRAGIGMLAIFLMPYASFAQETEVEVHGGFLSDSLKIGDETAYFLSARYSSKLTILFPDSSHAFVPFEYQRKTYFLTETTNGVSKDSAVYYLTTFEVDRVQRLSLPVYVVHDRDCTVMQPAADSVLITQFVAQVPDTVAVQELPLKMNTAYQKVFYNFNFWLVMIIVTALLVVAILVWVIFGKKIRRYFLSRRLQKNHASFMETYNRFLAQLQSTFSGPATESAVAVWKTYMEQLEARPYTKLTTRETVTLLKEPSISEDLGRIDRAIYGRDTTVIQPLENLKDFADQQFKRKLKEVQHG